MLLRIETAGPPAPRVQPMYRLLLSASCEGRNGRDRATRFRDPGGRATLADMGDGGPRRPFVQRATDKESMACRGITGHIGLVPLGVAPVLEMKNQAYHHPDDQEACAQAQKNHGL